MKNFEEIVAIASALKNADEWDEALCKELCEEAGLSEAWENADGETFEKVVEEAAEKLGVEIY